MKTILVTGANRGIGREVARQLAGRDCHVVIGARDADAGREAVETMGKLGGRVSFCQLNVAETASVAGAAQNFAAISERLDVLINNAGIFLPADRNILEVDEAVVRRIMETNALGAMRVSQAFLPLLRRSDAARIINVSSEAGQLLEGRPRKFAGYCLSKVMLNAMTVQLAAALPTFAVNAVHPGWTRTRLGTAFAPGSVEDAADSIVWLALDAPHSLTGKFVHERQEIPWAIAGDKGR